MFAGDRYGGGVRREERRKEGQRAFSWLRGKRLGWCFEVRGDMERELLGIWMLLLRGVADGGSEQTRKQRC